MAKNMTPMNYKLFLCTFYNIVLQNNYLKPEACYYLNEILRNNFNLKFLDLSNCNIGPRGMKQLEIGIERTDITELILRGCAIKNKGFHYLSKAIQINRNLQKLDLSQNCLDELCIEDLNSMILNSRYLQELDISWNALNKNIKTVFQALAKSDNIQELNLSWNGLDSECMDSLYSYLSTTTTLKRFDLSSKKKYILNTQHLS